MPTASQKRLKKGTFNSLCRAIEKRTDRNFYLPVRQIKWLEENSNGNASAQLRIILDQAIGNGFNKDAAIDLLEQIHQNAYSEKVREAASKLEEAIYEGEVEL